MYHISALLLPVILFALGISSLNYAYSQPVSLDTSGDQTNQKLDITASTNTLNGSQNNTIQQAINWNQSLALDPANIYCNDAGECGGIVEVAFESNNTIVLESYNSYRIFKVADMAKELSGFQIDDVSTTPQGEGIKYLVVLSK